MSKAEQYRKLVAEVEQLVRGERDLVANTANVAAAIYHRLPEVNWAGVYFLRGSQLVLGPFQGKPACVRIPLGRGVCGTAAARRQTVVVPDVHQFPGHIVCDPASQSEIVVPLLQGDRLLGVLDLDSPVRGRFDEQDREGLETVAALVCENSDAPVWAGGP